MGGDSLGDGCLCLWLFLGRLSGGCFFRFSSWQVGLWLNINRGGLGSRSFDRRFRVGFLLSFLNTCGSKDFRRYLGRLTQRATPRLGHRAATRLHFARCQHRFRGFEGTTRGATPRRRGAVAGAVAAFRYEPGVIGQFGVDGHRAIGCGTPQYQQSRDGSHSSPNPANAMRGASRTGLRDSLNRIGRQWLIRTGVHLNFLRHRLLRFLKGPEPNHRDRTRP